MLAMEEGMLIVARFGSATTEEGRKRPRDANALRTLSGRTGSPRAVVGPMGVLFLGGNNFAGRWYTFEKPHLAQELDPSAVGTNA